MVFRVQTGLRVCVTRVILAALVLVLLNFLRDRFFLVVDRGRVHPLFTHGFVSVLPILSAFLVAIMAKELAYVGFGERRWLVASDAVLAAAGAAMMVWFLTRPAFVAFPLSLRGGSDLIPTLNQLTAKVVQLLIIAFAAAFAWEAGKRITRLVQLW
jgi:hypothetical protein